MRGGGIESFQDLKAFSGLKKGEQGPPPCFGLGLGGTVRSRPCRPRSLALQLRTYLQAQTNEIERFNPF